jgi:hypothetical protein
VVPPGPVAAGNRSRARLVASIAAQVGSDQEARWIVEHGGPGGAQALADRRASGEPLQYVLGRWPFRSIELAVDPRVLIPRPETEQVVEVALGELARLARTGEATKTCVDLGTGSGAIALSLAVEGIPICAGLEVWATDVSSDALAVAEGNLESLAAGSPDLFERLHLAHGSWFEALPASLVGGADRAGWGAWRRSRPSLPVLSAGSSGAGPWWWRSPHRRPIRPSMPPDERGSPASRWRGTSPDGFASWSPGVEHGNQFRRWHRTVRGGRR